MIRILVFLVVVVLAAAALTSLAGVEGLTVVRIGDWNISGASAAFVGVGIFLIILIILLTLGVSGLAALPGRISRKREEGRRERGLIALTRGLEAVAAGDAGDAQRHARLADRHLTSQEGLTRLLTAQAAQLAGDEETAQTAFAAMLEAPETEFLGLRGLYLQSMNSGDHKEAREYAERAFRLRPGTAWAYQSVYQLNLERGAWGDARDALRKAQNHGLEDGDAARRREAALLTALAYAADATTDTDTALKDAEEALRKAPEFAPAAVLAARLEGAAGRRSKGAKLLEEAWAKAPHPAIAKTMADLFEGESVDRRAARLKKLAEKNPGVEESQLLIAEQDIALGEFEAARERLSTLLTTTPRARTFAAMAEATESLHGAEAAKVWQRRAAAAPLDPVPGADGVFNFTKDGWQRLIREFGDHGRLAPPPLEEMRTALSHEEVLMLTAPPPAPAVEPEAEAEAETAPTTEEAPEEAEENASQTDASAADGPAQSEAVEATETPPEPSPPSTEEQAPSEAPPVPEAAATGASAEDLKQAPGRKIFGIGTKPATKDSDETGKAAPSDKDDTAS